MILSPKVYNIVSDHPKFSVLFIRDAKYADAYVEGNSFILTKYTVETIIGISMSSSLTTTNLSEAKKNKVEEKVQDLNYTNVVLTTKKGSIIIKYYKISDVEALINFIASF